MDVVSLIAVAAGASISAVARVRRRKTLPENLPAHPWRRRIIAFIKARPGSQLKDVCDDLELNRGTATHHLPLLEDAGILEGLEGGHAHHFFPAGTPDYRKRQMALLRRGRVLEVVIRVHDQPGIMQKDLGRQLGLGRKALRRYIDRLTAEGLLVEEADAQARRYYPTGALNDILEDFPP